MALCKKCDRCEKMYDHYNIHIGALAVNAIKIVSLNNADAYMSPAMDLDLCPECMSELIKFLTDKKKKKKI